MALQFRNIPEHDLSKGIDVRSAENLLEPGYVEDALNADVLERRLRKREGYQGFAGCVPLRVESLKCVNGSPDTIEFTFNQNIDLSNLNSRPIVAFGRTSKNVGGDFSATDAVEYYSSFTADPRKTLSAPGPATLTLPATDHGFSTTNFFTGIIESTSLTDFDSTDIFTDQIEVDKTTLIVDVDHTVSSDKEVFVFYSEKQASTGSVFVDDGLTIGTGTTVTSITAATHGLSNFQIVPRIYRDTGTQFVEIISDKVEIDTAGKVDITITNGIGSSFTAKVILSAVPINNIANGAIAAATTDPNTGIITPTTSTITITNITSAFVFTATYLEDLGTGDKELIIPNSVVYDDSADTLTFQIVNGSSSSKNFEIYFEFGAVTTNVISVTSNSQTISSTATDSSPQMTVWGICHDEDIYGASKVAREGWVTHLDSYRRSAEQRLISGLGGTLYAARTRSEVGTTHLLPQLFSNLRARVSTETVIAPLFHNTGATVSRKRGYVTLTGGGNNFAEVTDIAFDISSGNVKYTLSLPAKAVFDSSNAAVADIDTASAISIAAGLEDKLTVNNTGFSVHNGTFTIKSFTETSTSVTLFVENTAVTSDDFNEDDVGGNGGIFTEQIPLTTTSKFISGDQILASIFTADKLILTENSSSMTLEVSNVVDIQTVPAGLRISGKRTSSVIPLRTSADVADVTNFVTADNVSYTDIDRLLTIKSINALSDDAISISGDGTDATISSVSDTSFFLVGDQILLVQAGVYTGVVTISDIPSTSTLEFKSSLTATSISGIIEGKTIHIDESFEWEDNTTSAKSVTVEKRWIPIEAPDDSFDLTPSQRVSYFDSKSYVLQDFIRSTMVSDNMYLTNLNDEVLKFDGTNLYRAGLFRWQPGLFVSTDTAAADPIDLDSVTTSFAGSSGNKFEVADADRLTFELKTEIQDNRDGAFYTVVDTDDGTPNQIIVNKIITGTDVSDTFVDGDVTVGTDTVTIAAHPFKNNDRVNLTTTTTLPAGLATGIDYFIIESTSTTFKLALTAGGSAVDITAAASGGTHTIAKSKILTKVHVFKYYFRLNAIDANSNIIASAVTGQEDFIVKIADNAAINMRLIGFPAWDNYDYDRLELEIYRTESNTQAPYFKLTTLSLSFNNGDVSDTRDQGYIDFSDGFADDELRDLDEVNSALLGEDLGINFTEPLRAKYITSANNRTVLANLKDYPELDIQLLGDNAVDANFAPPGATNLLWIFKRDSTDTSYKTFTDTAVSIADDTITITSHGFNNDDQVDFLDGGGLPAATPAITAITNFFIVGATADTFQLSTTKGGAVIDITSIGASVTHTVRIATDMTNVARYEWVNDSAAKTITTLDQTSKIILRVTSTGHGLTVGDWVYMYKTDTPIDGIQLEAAGWFQVKTRVSADIFEVTHKNETTGVLSGIQADKIVVATNERDIPVLLGTDGNRGVIGGQASTNEDEKNVAMNRLAEAINASMRKTDISIATPDFSEFTPWIIGNSDGSFNVGQLLIRQPKVESTNLEVVLPIVGITATTSFDIFVGQLLRSNSTASTPSEVTASTRVFPSRVIISFENFPEIFDNPTAILPGDSLSIIDVNPADGQEITGVIPFFGDAAFGASQKSGIVVVFKENSIYLIDISQKVAGGDPVQKLETQGLGCTAPFSIAVTKQGIIFANESGIYRLRRNLSIEYVGQKMERNWLENVNRDQLAIMQGHHYSIGRRYKLSVPVGSSQTENNEVYVYHHTKELEGERGAWTRYDNHPATGWANLGADAFFASTSGRVFSIRRLGDKTDFRDDSSAITMEVVARAMDFGIAGIRKVISSVTTHYRALLRSASTAIAFATDLLEEFEDTDALVIERNVTPDGLSDDSDAKIRSIKTHLGRRRAVYGQFKFSNDAIDEPLDIAGFDIRVAPLKSRGMTQAADTTKT